MKKIIYLISLISIVAFNNQIIAEYNQGSGDSTSIVPDFVDSNYKISICSPTDKSACFPPGTHQQSCNTCSITKDSSGVYALSCHCKKMDGNWNLNTYVPIAGCKNITNNNGNLICQ